MDFRNYPFAPGAGTPPPELAGRDDLRERGRITLERLRRGRPTKSMLMVGLRGVGKTVLLEVHACLAGRIEPIDKADALLGAELFNAAGRRRTLKTDALIAGAAIHTQVDFESFFANGLRLIPARI